MAEQELECARLILLGVRADGDERGAPDRQVRADPQLGGLDGIAVDECAVGTAEVAQEEQAVEASTQYRDLAMTRYQTGVDTYLNVLTAQNTLLGNQQTIATLRTNQMVTSVQLIAALGGGWSTRTPGPSGAF